jgi:hypothetical protein
MRRKNYASDLKDKEWEQIYLSQKRIDFFRGFIEIFLVILFSRG